VEPRTPESRPFYLDVHNVIVLQQHVVTREAHHRRLLACPVTATMMTVSPVADGALQIGTIYHV
jgi:hypothetical protein